MAITTQAGADAGAQPPYYLYEPGSTGEGASVLTSLFYSAGNPAAAAAPAPGLAGAALTSYAGQIPFTNPPSGNAYLYRHEMTSGASSPIGAQFLCDRLWHNSGIVVTDVAAQTINSVAWPARDLDASTNGRGVQVGIEVRTATTNAGAITTITMSYTNSAGVAGRTATMTSFPATAAAVSFVQFQLQTGDEGVRSIQSITLGTSLVAGVIHLVAFRILDMIAFNHRSHLSGHGAVVNGHTVRNRDMHACGFVRLFSNTVPWHLINPTGSGAVPQMGIFQVAFG